MLTFRSADEGGAVCASGAEVVAVPEGAQVVGAVPTRRRQRCGTCATALLRGYGKGRGAAAAIAAAAAATGAAAAVASELLQYWEVQRLLCTLPAAFVDIQSRFWLSLLTPGEARRRVAAAIAAVAPMTDEDADKGQETRAVSSEPPAALELHCLPVWWLKYSFGPLAAAHCCCSGIKSCTCAAAASPAAAQMMQQLGVVGLRKALRLLRPRWHGFRLAVFSSAELRRWSKHQRAAVLRVVAAAAAAAMTAASLRPRQKPASHLRWRATAAATAAGVSRNNDATAAPAGAAFGPVHRVRLRQQQQKKQQLLALQMHHLLETLSPQTARNSVLRCAAHVLRVAPAVAATTPGDEDAAVTAARELIGGLQSLHFALLRCVERQVSVGRGASAAAVAGSRQMRQTPAVAAAAVAVAAAASAMEALRLLLRRVAAAALSAAANNNMQVIGSVHRVEQRRLLQEWQVLPLQQWRAAGEEPEWRQTTRRFLV